MGNIISWIIIAALAFPACARLREDCLQRKRTVDYVAAVADYQLRVGMSKEEVRRLLGEPEEVVIYSGRGSPEAWKYYVLEGCKKHQGLSAPSTELVFRYGKLERWLTYGK